MSSLLGNWQGQALIVLGIYVFYAPFAYKHTLENRGSHVAAVLGAILGYVVIFLYLVGVAQTFYGCGSAIDKPAEYCGSGCIEPGYGHQESPKPANLLLGLSMVTAGYFLGKATEKNLEADNLNANLCCELCGRGNTLWTLWHIYFGQQRTCAVAA